MRSRNSPINGGGSQELTQLVTAGRRTIPSSTSTRLAETIANSAEELNSTLKASGESLVLDLNLRGGEVAAKLEQTGARITDSIVSAQYVMADSVPRERRTSRRRHRPRSDAVREMLATRLAAFEEMFSHSGVELGEKISRDASTLGDLITRHLGEFDRTVKTYGAELIERLGERTQDVSESMRSYIDSFDNRVTTKTNEVTPRSISVSDASRKPSTAARRR